MKNVQFLYIPYKLTFVFKTFSKVNEREGHEENQYSQHHKPRGTWNMWAQ